MNNMEYRIIHKEQFFIAGISKRITLQFKGENHQLDSLYQKMTEEMKQKLLQINNTEPSGIVNVSAEFSDRTKEGSELTQYLGVATTESSLPRWKAYRKRSVPRVFAAVWPWSILLP